MMINCSLVNQSIQNFKKLQLLLLNMIELDLKRAYRIIITLLILSCSNLLNVLFVV